MNSPLTAPECNTSTDFQLRCLLYTAYTGKKPDFSLPASEMLSDTSEGVQIDWINDSPKELQQKINSCWGEESTVRARSRSSPVKARRKDIRRVYAVGTSWSQSSMRAIFASQAKASSVCRPFDKVTDRLVAFLDGHWRFVNATPIDRLLDASVWDHPSFQDSDEAEPLPMTRKECDKLDVGDVVRPSLGHEGYVVTANYGKRITVVRTADITNPREWVLVSKANQTKGNHESDSTSD